MKTITKKIKENDPYVKWLIRFYGFKIHVNEDMKILNTLYITLSN